MNFSRLAEETKWRSSDSDTSQVRTSHTWQTPLTGRDTELSLLRDRWEQAQEGMGQVVFGHRRGWSRQVSARPNACRIRLAGE